MIYYSYPRYMVVSSKCELFSFVCCILHYYHSIFKQINTYEPKDRNHSFYTDFDFLMP